MYFFFFFSFQWWQTDKINIIKLYCENKTISGFNLRSLLYQQGRHDYVRGIVEKIYDLFLKGKIKPVIDSTWAFEDITEAMQKLHERKNVGKIILDPAQEPKPRPVEEVTEKKRKGSSKDKDKEKDKDKAAEGAEKQDGEGSPAKK